MHVATTSVERLVDYCLHTPEDGLTSGSSVRTLKKQIDRNLEILKTIESQRVDLRPANEKQIK